MGEHSRAAARARLFAEFLLEADQAMICVSLTIPELEELAYATTSPEMRARLCTAIALHDPDLADKITQEMK